MSGVPNVPTVAESGLPGYEADTWMGLSGPAGLPLDIVKRLRAELGAVLQLPEFRGRVVALGMEPVMSSPEESARIMDQNTRAWRCVVTESKAKFTQ